MASTSANRVKVLIDMPATASTPKAPSSSTGTAIAGIRIARQFCKKRNITTTTSAMASANVALALLSALLSSAARFGRVSRKAKVAQRSGRAHGQASSGAELFSHVRT